MPAFEGEWTTHPCHQLVYAAAGVLHLQVGDGEWLLPPQRAAWIRAGTRYRLHAAEPVALRVSCLPPALAEAPAKECGVFDVTALAREMLLAAVRWGPDRTAGDDRANRFFLALAALAVEWVSESREYRLPKAQSRELEAAMTYALENLTQEPTIDEAARIAEISPRTLARRFQEEASTTWRDFLHDARMMRAMEMLADRKNSVTDAAYGVGFNSLGAFTRAFVDFTGERPRDYRRRVTDVPE
jgi:AraC-like DNA-binding protein